MSALRQNMPIKYAHVWFVFAFVYAYLTLTLNMRLYVYNAIYDD